MPDNGGLRLWLHSRKGRIHGRVVREDDTWMQIELAYDHALKYGSEGNRGRIDDAGDIITVRKSYMTQVGTDET